MQNLVCLCVCVFGGWGEDEEMRGVRESRDDILNLAYQILNEYSILHFSKFDSLIS